MGLVKARVAESAPELPEDLPAALSSEDATTRRRAARLLGERRQGADLLAERLAVETDGPVREAIAAALLSQPNPAVARRLVELLSGEDAGLRNHAIELLAAMPGEVAPLMEGILADPDSDVRIFAVNVLANLPHTRVQDWLIAVVEHEQHVNVCAAAVEVLAELAFPAAAPALRRLAERFPEEDFLRFSIQIALSRMGPS